MITLHQQRGAMFGLDARLALVILAGLSIITGSALVFSTKKAEGHGLYRNIEAITEAVIAMQYDLKSNPLNAVPTGADIEARAFSALSNRNEIKPALQRSWLGPYLIMQTWDSDYIQYGTHSLLYATENSPTASCASNCFLWLSLQNVPEPVVSSLNDIMDGADETTPDTSGKVRWSEVSGQNRTYVRITEPLQ